MEKNKRFIVHSADFVSAPEFVRLAYKLKKQGIAPGFGYVLFWRICEECRRLESAIPADVLEILADDMGIPAESVPLIVKCALESGLANETENGIIPKLVSDCLAEMEETKKKRSEWGRKGAQAKLTYSQAKPTYSQAKQTKTKTKTKTETEINISSCSELFPEETPTEPTAAEIAFSEFSLELNTGEAYRVPIADVEEYRRLYPAVDVPQELRNMAGWLKGNPARRKTRRGIGAFITSWLSRTQDKGGKPTTPSAGQTAQPRGAFVVPPASEYGSFYK